MQEAKISSAIENIFTTDDELFKAYSDQNKTFSDQYKEITGASKEVLRYREALWSGYNYLKKPNQFDKEYFIKVFQEIMQTSDGIRPDFLNTTIKQGGSGPNSGKVTYTPPKGATTIKK